MEFKPPEIIGISEEEKNDLIAALNKFDSWLVQKGIATTPTTITYVNLPFADADWTMIVTGSEVSFNTYVRKKMFSRLL
jgi:hypothetical protein